MSEEVSFDKLSNIITKDGQAALVLFAGNWCGDCKVFKPTWDAWNKAKTGPIFKIEVQRGGKEWREWAINEIPTVAAYLDGIEKGRAQGTISERDLDRLWNLIR
jgi:thiol-disulfide isomerase/thioredoxin